MNTKLTALLAAMCVSASVFAQTQPVTPPNNGSTTTTPNANVNLGQSNAKSGEQNASGMQNNSNRQNTTQMTRDQAKTTNTQRTPNPNCVDGANATPPGETVANAGKHDNRLAKADCKNGTTQR